MIENHQPFLRRLLAVVGPGLLVMLADTDAGCLITAAQSGAQWGYAMVLPQLVLIPVLFMAQEMTVRLGIVTHEGHGTLIRQYFGRGWAWLAAVTLGISAVGALLTEFIGIAGVGELFGVSKWVTIPIATIFLIAIAFLGKYQRVEKVGVMVGIAEFAFVIAMVMAKPQLSDLLHGLATVPWHNRGYVYLVAANVGAVIMPWMLFYQQGAVVDKHLTPADIPRERRDTAIGTLVTQAVMIVFIVTYAATVGKHGGSGAFATVGQMAAALAPYLGRMPADLLIGISLLGGALVAALVVALAGTWGLTEVLGWPHSLNEPFDRKSAGFYLIYIGAHVIGAILVLANIQLVSLAVTVEVINALLVPIVLGFLLLLEAKALPAKYRMHGWYRVVATTMCLLVMVFGLYMLGPMLHLW
ncbi:NRAMP family divalent metal transporter [Lacticaseibacillus sp. GG6-2]